MHSSNLGTLKRRQELGIWPALIAGAASIFGAKGKKSAVESGGPASGGAIAPAGPTTTTITVSPQISPTFQQTQSSPGSTQRAAATMIPSPAASPYGSNAPFPPPITAGGFPVSALDPMGFTPISEWPMQAGRVPFNWQPVIWVGGGLVGLLLVTQMLKRS